MTNIGARALTAIMRSKKATSVVSIVLRVVSAALLMIPSSAPKWSNVACTNFLPTFGSSRSAIT